MCIDRLILDNRVGSLRVNDECFVISWYSLMLIKFEQFLNFQFLTLSSTSPIRLCSARSVVSFLLGFFVFSAVPLSQNLICLYIPST